MGPQKPKSMAHGSTNAPIDATNESTWREALSAEK